MDIILSSALGMDRSLPLITFLVYGLIGLLRGSPELPFLASPFGTSRPNLAYPQTENGAVRAATVASDGIRLEAQV